MKLITLTLILFLIIHSAPSLDETSILPGVTVYRFFSPYIIPDKVIYRSRYKSFLLGNRGMHASNGNIPSDSDEGSDVSEKVTKVEEDEDDEEEDEVDEDGDDESKKSKKSEKDENEDDDDEGDEDEDEDEDESEEEDERKPMKAHSLNCCHKLRTTNALDCHIDLITHGINMVYLPEDHLINTIKRFHDDFFSFADRSFKDKCIVTDAWMRFRHDTFCSFIKFDLGVFDDVDKPFSDFGINSNKTPDFIVERPQFFVVVEVSVTRDFITGAMQKGSYEHGIRPKYANDIKALELHSGKRVFYHPVVIDVGHMNSTQYADELNTMFARLERTPVMTRVMESARMGFLAHSAEVTRNFGYCMEEVLTKQRVTDIIREKPSTLKGMYGGRFEHHYHIIPLPYNTINYLKNYFVENKHEFYEKKRLGFDKEKNEHKFTQSSKGMNYHGWEALCSAGNWNTVSKYVDYYNAGEMLTMNTHPVDTCLMTSSTVKEFQAVRVEYEGLPDHVFDTLPPVEEPSPNYARLLNMADDAAPEISIYSDPSYEKKMLACYQQLANKMYLGKDPFKGFDVLATRKNTKENVQAALDKYTAALKSENIEDATRQQYDKPPFLYPVCLVSHNHLVGLTEKPSGLINRMKEELVSGYTFDILSKVENYKMGPQDASVKADLANLNEKHAQLIRRINYLTVHFNLMKKPKLDKDGKVIMVAGADEAKKELISLKSDIGKVRSGYRSHKRNKIVMSSKLERDKFADEMKHWKQKGDRKERATSKGAMMKYSENYRDIFVQLLEELSQYSRNVFPAMDTHIAPDCGLLKDFKQLAMDDCAPLYEYFSQTALYNALCFIQNFCTTLLYNSQTSDNSELITLDNLGFRNTILISKGGKKVFRTKSSRLYRICYMVPESIKNMLSSNVNFKFFTDDVNSMMLTPWQQMSEVLLCDGLSIVSRYASFFCTIGMQVSYSTPFELFKHLFLNMLLGLHAKRGTEMMMHGVRYIIVNKFALSSGVSMLLKEYAGFNHDWMQSFLRFSIRDNYMKLYEHDDTKMLNFFTGELMDSPDKMANFIYSTYLMPKAPYNQRVEQAKNLKNVLEIHEEWSALHLGNDFISQHETSNIELGDSEDLNSYLGRLNSHSFTYDGKSCYNMGRYLAGYLSNKLTKSEIETKWSNIMKRKYTSMATTKGLRSDGEDFFGKKGYFVIYKELLTNKNYMDELWRLMETLKNGSADDYNKAMMKVDELNISFREKILETNFTEVIAHIVDKSQRAGSREIYVFHKESKLNQMPLEDFFGYLCQSVDIELISVPSNRRLHAIHSMLFEKNLRGECKKTYMTLDCKKWAPKSVLNKFIAFLHGLKPVLPEEFYEMTLYFFGLKYNQKIVTRSNIAKILINNANCKNSNYLVTDGDQSSFVMPYSFIMGWFNYFSSLVHAGAHMYNKHLMNQVKMADNDSNTMHMTKQVLWRQDIKVHSDDSGGITEVALTKTKIMSVPENSKEVVYTPLHDLVSTFLIICAEVMMKAGNMMWSDKKSMLSETYFEVLSILYVLSKLVSMNPKFLSSIIFKPTDKGPVMDMMEALSKVIECVVNGVSFSQAYIIMKFLSFNIWSFYYNRAPNENDYLRPVQILGMPDSHPIMVLVAGSNADAVRLYNVDRDELKRMMSAFNSLNEGKNMKGCFSIPVCKPHIKLVIDEFKDFMRKVDETAPEDDEVEFAIQNSVSNSAAIDMIKFANLCRQPGFIGALQDESSVRMVSRTFYYRTSACLRVGDRLHTPRSFLDQMSTLSTLSDLLSAMNFDDRDTKSEDLNFKLFELLNAEAIKYNDFMAPMKVDRNVVSKGLTCKPVHLAMKRFYQPLKITAPTIDLAIMIHGNKKTFPLISNMKAAVTDYNHVKSYMDMGGYNDLSLPLKYEYLDKMRNKDEAKYYMYATVHHDFRNITNYGEYNIMLTTNSKHGVTYGGIVTRFNQMLTNLSSSMNNFDSNDMLNTQVILLFLSQCKANGSSTDWHFNPIAGITDEVMNTQDLLDTLKEYWQKQTIMWSLVGLKIISAMGETLKDDGATYYFYIRSQQKKSGRWVGGGELCIKVVHDYFMFGLKEDRVNSVSTNAQEGVLSEYTLIAINAVLVKEGLKTLHASFDNYNIPAESKALGQDSEGFVRICSSKNLKNSLPKTEMLVAPVFKSTGDMKTWDIKERGAMMFIEKHSEDRLLSMRIYFISPEPALYVEKFSKMIAGTPENYAKLNNPTGESSLIEAVGRIMASSSLVKASYTFEQMSTATLNSKLYAIYEDYVSKGGFLLSDTLVLPSDTGSIQHLMFESGNILETKTADFKTMALVRAGKLSEFANNKIVELYPKLVNRAIRSEILADLTSLTLLLEDADINYSMMEVLKKYGLGSVVGALNTDFSVKDDHIFSLITMTTDSVENTWFKGLAVRIASAVCQTLTSNELYLASEPIVFFSRVIKDKDLLLRHLTAWIHQIMRTRVGGSKLRYTYKSTTSWFFKSAISKIFNDSKLMESFEDSINKDSVLRKLPTGVDFLQKWCNMYNTAFCLNWCEEKPSEADISNMCHNSGLPRSKYSYMIELPQDMNISFIKDRKNFKSLSMKRYFPYGEFMRADINIEKKWWEDNMEQYEDDMDVDDLDEDSIVEIYSHNVKDSNLICVTDTQPQYSSEINNFGVSAEHKIICFDKIPAAKGPAVYYQPRSYYNPFQVNAVISRVMSEEVWGPHMNAKIIEINDMDYMNIVGHAGEVGDTDSYNFGEKRSLQARVTVLDEKKNKLAELKTQYENTIYTDKLKRARSALNDIKDDTSRKFLLSAVNKKIKQMESENEGLMNSIKQLELAIFDLEESKRVGKSKKAVEKSEPVEMIADNHLARYRAMINLIEIGSIDVKREKLEVAVTEISASALSSEEAFKIYESPEIYGRAMKVEKRLMKLKDPMVEAEIEAIHPMFLAQNYHISARRKRLVETTLKMLDNVGDPDEKAFASICQNFVNSAHIIENESEWEDVWISLNDKILYQISKHMENVPSPSFSRKPKGSLLASFRPR